MKISIKTKLFIYMMVIVLFFSLVLIFSNTFLVEKYYMAKQKKALKATSLTIEEGLKEYFNKEINDDEFYTKIINLEREKGISINILSSSGTNIYPVFDTINIDSGVINIPALSLDSYSSDSFTLATSDDRVEVIETDSSSSYFSIIKDSNDKPQNLSYNKLYSNFIISTSLPMERISESISILNEIIGIVGIITLIFTGLWSIFISIKFTKPITNINNITNRMKDLDFSRSIEVKGKDEISQLSQNINSLSSSLDKTIFELNEKNKKLESDISKERELDEKRKEFISNVSHELKTPIFLIQGYAEGLKDNISEDKKDLYCSIISDEAEKMNNMLEEFIQLVKLEDKGQNNLVDFFEINDFIKSIIANYSIILKDKEINLNFKPIEDILILGEKDKIEQVFRNIINNGIEHLDKDRLLSISLEKKDKLEIEIFNSGKNIPKEHIDKIWDSFYKIDSSRKRDLGGTGLGLSIVKAILDNHNNKYQVVNREDGVSFIFELEIKS